MVIDGYTTDRVRTWSTDSVKHGDDVGMFLPDKVHHRAAYYSSKPKVSNSNRYKYKADRSAETDAARFKGIGIKYTNSCELYN